MRLQAAFLVFLLLGILNSISVLANREMQPEPCFRCPYSRSIDDTVCGDELYQFNYYGDWEHCREHCTPGDYECSESSTCDPEAYVKISFIGNRIKLYSAVGPWGGEACVKVDYKDSTDVSFYCHQKEGDKLVYDSGLLPYGKHTLLVSNKSEFGKRITIDRVEYFRYPNLIQNPSFEEKCPTCPYAEEKYPPRWTAEAYTHPAVLKWDCEVAHTGNKSFYLASECPNYLKIFQNVHVRRHTNCLISAWIKTNNVASNLHLVDAGANVSPINVKPNVRSCGLFGDNCWTQQWVTFNTCELDYVTVAGELGAPYGPTRGCAWFDDFEFICEEI